MNAIASAPLTAPLKFCLPVLSPDDAANVLPVDISHFAFDAGSAASIQLTIDPTCLPGAIVEEIDLTYGGAPFTVRLDQSLLGPLVLHAGYGDSLATVEQDPELAALVLEHFLTNVISLLESTKGQPIQIAHRSDHGRTDLPIALRVRFHLASDQLKFACTGELIARDADGAAKLCSLIAAHRPAQTEAPLALPAPFSLVSQPFLLTQGEIAALVPGDGLMLDRDFNWQAPLILAFSPRHRAQVDWRGNRLIVSGISNLTPTSEEFPAMQSFDDKSLAIDTLPVALSLELDRLEMSFSALGEVRVGSVVPFRSGVPEKVRVLANGRFFATADLLQIGDRLGVRITSISPRAE